MFSLKPKSIVTNCENELIVHKYIFLDLDECCVGTYCHDNATCTNVPGSYYCTCKTGFTGNNTHCEGT